MPILNICITVNSKDISVYEELKEITEEQAIKLVNALMNHIEDEMKELNIEY